jgi:hypothetical protein
MEFLNLHTSTLDSPEVIGAEPIDRGTWLMLLRYCIGQENGGTIPGLGDWKDRKCQQILRVTRAELRRESDLWTWHGPDLSVTHYPTDKEAIVRTKREIAKTNGATGGRPKKNPDETNIGFQSETNIGSESVAENKPSPKAEGKGREGKTKEREGDAGRTNAELAEMLCLIHPKRCRTGPALAAALAALKRHLFEDILAGTTRYAEAVATWTETEKLQFVTNPERFFHEDTWRQPAENWKSRKGINGTQKKTMTNAEAIAALGGRAIYLDPQPELIQ